MDHSSSDYTCDFYLEQTAEICDLFDQNSEENDCKIHENNDFSHNFNSSKPNSSYIYDRVKFTKKQRDQSLFSFTDKPLMDLYILHRKTHAPIGLFDDTIKWLQKHINSLVHKQYQP